MTIDQFEDYIGDDLAWRKLEISQLFMILNTVESKEIIGKSMILLLYAHWEGFIKNSSKCYLKYVSDKNIKIKDLTSNFEAIMLKQFARDCIDNDSKNLSREFALINKQKKVMNTPFKVKVQLDNPFDKEIIDTYNNLSSKVLASIIEMIGIKYNDAMKTRENFMDSNLVKNRNAIGHGSQVKREDSEDGLPTDFSKIYELKEFVIAMLVYFSEVLIKYVEDEYYLVSKVEARDLYELEQEEKLKLKLNALTERAKEI